MGKVSDGIEGGTGGIEGGTGGISVEPPGRWALATVADRRRRAASATAAGREGGSRRVDEGWDAREASGSANAGVRRSRWPPGARSGPRRATSTAKNPNHRESRRWPATRPMPTARHVPGLEQSTTKMFFLAVLGAILNEL